MDSIKRLYGRINNYMYDSSIDIKERTFMLFSGAVLVALFRAVPFGLILREPISQHLLVLFSLHFM